MGKQYQILRLFDFDGTLFRSPEKPDWWGEAKWWTDPASLAPPMVPEAPSGEWWNQDVVGRARYSIQQADSLTILATGRHRAIYHRRVHALLKQNRLRFDAVYLSDGGATEDFKLRVLQHLANRNPTIRKLEVWEDRAPHLKLIAAWADRAGLECVPHLITHPAHALGCTQVEWQALHFPGVPSAQRVAFRFLTRST